MVFWVILVISELWSRLYISDFSSVSLDFFCRFLGLKCKVDLALRLGNIIKSWSD